MPHTLTRNKQTKYPQVHKHKIEVQLSKRLSQIYDQHVKQSLDKQADTKHFYSRKKEIAP